MNRMATFVSDFYETDVDIRNAKKQKRNMKRMSTSVLDFYETNLDIHFGQFRRKKFCCAEIHFRS